MVRIGNDTALDQALQYIIDQSDTIFILSTASANITFDQAASVTLASVAIASTVFSISNGLVNGRRATVAIVSGVSVTNTGTANHVMLVNASASTITYVTEASAQALTAGNSLNTSAWNIELRDPAAP